MSTRPAPAISAEPVIFLLMSIDGICKVRKYFTIAFDTIALK